VQQYVGPVNLHAVNLQRSKPVSARAYYETFGVVPRFGQQHNELVFARSALDLPVRGAEPGLAEILGSYSAQLAAQAPALDALLQRVRSTLVRELNIGAPALAHLARKLGSSERTLRRQLQARGTHYKQLLDEVRHDLACRQLTLGAPLSEIAQQLGFHGSRALHKAFIRWTGLTPSQYRQRSMHSGG
jgi:AraC-like DNA-binding protein